MKTMEYEVTKDAVEKYKSYAIYSDWKGPCGCGDEGRPFRKSMPGYYLKSSEHPSFTIVGDILTSNKVWGNAKERNNDRISSLLTVFENIYHCNGNYIPIPEINNMKSANLSGNNCDTYTHHLNVCKDAILGELKTTYPAWQRWAEEVWKPYCQPDDRWERWRKFVNEFYLIDFVDGDYRPIAFCVGRDVSDQVGIKNTDSDECVIETITKTIDLIVKREYRLKRPKKDLTDPINFDSQDFIEFRKNFIKSRKDKDKFRVL